MLCLLAVGPLQVQAAYACALMDTVVHDDCCCDGAATEADRVPAEPGTPAKADQAPCCEVSVNITIDREAQQHTPVLKPPEPNSDLDPAPAAIGIFYALLLPSQQPASHTYFHRRLPDVGSDTWLVTRRLRI